MVTLKEFRYWDPETRRSEVVPAGSEIPERAANILGHGKIEQLKRTGYAERDEAMIVTPPKRGRPKKKGA